MSYSILTEIMEEFNSDDDDEVYYVSREWNVIPPWHRAGYKYCVFYIVTRYARRIASNKLVTKQLVYIEWKKLYVDQSVNNIIYTWC